MTLSIFKRQPGARRFRSRATQATALSALFVLGMLLTLVGGAAAAPTAVSLATANSFAVLAGTAITDIPPSPITGDVGVSPASGSSITGLTCAEVTGTIYSVDGSGPLPCRVTNAFLLTGAKNDLTKAYVDAAGRTPDTTFVAADNQLGGQTLAPGVYKFGHGTTANLSGNLTLSGDASAVWIFQATSDLVTASSSTVTLTGGAQSCNVFWQVTSSATLGTSSTFRGTILALTSITVTNGVTIDGRVLAQNGAVTLDHDTITKSTCAAPPPPPPATTTAATTTAATTAATTTTAPTTTVAPTTTAATTTKAGSVAAAKKLATAKKKKAAGHARPPLRHVGFTG